VLPVALPFQSWIWRDTQLRADPQSSPPDTLDGTTIVPGYGPGANIPIIDLAVGSETGLPPPGQLPPGSPTLCVSYQSTVHNLIPPPGLQAPAQLQEALLFARDPQEVYTSLTDPKWSTFDPNSISLEQDDATTDQEWQDAFQTHVGPTSVYDESWPDAIAMPYPLPSLGGVAQTIGPLAISDFWESSPPNGPGLGPTNLS
jgi:hypothetical protein